MNDLFNFNTMKIFISGATGSIGAHLTKILSAQGEEIHALVRSLEKAKNLSFKNVIPFQGDISDISSIEKAMVGCEQAYHVAALAKVWAKDSGEFYRSNVTGTLNVLEAARQAKVKKIVVTSTAGIFGPSIHGMVNEEKIRDLDFFNEYEGSKCMAECITKDFIIQHKMDIVLVSPTRVYGPFLFGPPAAGTLLVDQFVNHGWRFMPGTGKEIGNYVYIEDVAIGHVLAMEKGKTGHNYILGGENHDYNNFYRVLKEVSGIKRRMIKIPLWVQMMVAQQQLFLAKRFGKQPKITPKWIPKGKYNWEVSSDKAIRELGLTVTPLREGLERTVASLR
jgi:nucleoside-diphosphate-sugar epimerase